jgi:hypothetical protein
MGGRRRGCDQARLTMISVASRRVSCYFKQLRSCSCLSRTSCDQWYEASATRTKSHAVKMPVEQGEDYQQDGHADPTLYASASRGIASSYLDVPNPGAICPRQLAVQPASAERQPFECTA